MTFTDHEIKELVRAIVAEVLNDGAVLPLCRIETARMDAIEKSLMAAYKILTGGDNPEQGLVAKTIRQDGALALNRTAIEDLRKVYDKNTDRGWGIWAAVIVMILSSVLNLVFGK